LESIHARGKEKKVEAPVHALEEYLTYIEHKDIYLATDDQDNVNATRLFPQFNWIMNIDEQR
jgi:hypothetical protein